MRKNRRVWVVATVWGRRKYPKSAFKVAFQVSRRDGNAVQAVESLMAEMNLGRYSLAQASMEITDVEYGTVDGVKGRLD